MLFLRCQQVKLLLICKITCSHAANLDLCLMRQTCACISENKVRVLFLLRLSLLHHNDWSGLSPQLLTEIFELQHNALDNCAAACVSSSWRTAVNSSRIIALHLHADFPSYNRNWRGFFTSRKSCGHLKLTHAITPADADSYVRAWQDVQNCFTQLPMDCDSLDIDGNFIGELHFYTSKRPPSQAPDNSDNFQNFSYSSEFARLATADSADQIRNSGEC